MQELRLKTVGRYIPEVMYFYDGAAPVKDGVLTLPVDPNKLAWAQRAFLKGFREDPDTGRILSLEEIVAVYEAKTAKSEGDDTDVAGPDNGVDGGGQSPDSDGIRASEPQGGGGLSEEGLESSVSDGPAERPARKRTRRRTTSPAKR